MAAISPATAINIRQGDPADAPLLASLAARLFTQAYGATHPEPELSRYLARSFGIERLRAELGDPRVCVLVAEDTEGAPAGYAYLREPAGPVPAGVLGLRPIEIVRFYVDSAWHGRGVAGALMNACDDEARHRGADALWLDVWQEAARPIAFYRRAGFAIVGATTFHFGDRVDADHVMARVVSGNAG